MIGFMKVSHLTLLLLVSSLFSVPSFALDIMSITYEGKFKGFDHNEARKVIFTEASESTAKEFIKELKGL